MIRGPEFPMPVGAEERDRIGGGVQPVQRLLALGGVGARRGKRKTEVREGQVETKGRDDARWQSVVVSCLAPLCRLKRDHCHRSSPCGFLTVGAALQSSSHRDPPRGFPTIGVARLSQPPGSSTRLSHSRRGATFSHRELPHPFPRLLIPCNHMFWRVPLSRVASM